MLCAGPVTCDNCPVPVSNIADDTWIPEDVPCAPTANGLCGSWVETFDELGSHGVMSGKPFADLSSAGVFY